jgi:flavin-dependent dehydrogenase
MEKFTPWEYERASHVQLTDRRGFLSGSLTPVVRDPVGRLPGGGVVLGMGDSVVTNDPITGQGANNAAHCAAIYRQAILDQRGGPFDQQWMRATFARYLDYVLPVTRWTNAMLLPPPEHMLAILAAAQENSQIRQRFANGFSDPRDVSGWLMDPDKAREYLRAVTGGPAPLAS